MITPATRVFLCLVGLCAWDAAAAEPSAEFVLKNGRIVTVDGQFRIAQAMAVREGRVLSVGSNRFVETFVDQQTRVVDLKGRMVLPGLIDSHTHPPGAAQFEADHPIASMESIADVLQYVRQRARVVPKGEWIRLSQVFITRLREQRYPSLAELDAAAPEHPVFFRTGPDGSANSLALQENGIDKEFAAQHPENVLVDPATGEPSGIIRKWSGIIDTQASSDQKTFSPTDKDDRLVMLLDDYRRSGITAIIDRNCSDASRAQYERLLQADRLAIRVALSRSLSPNESLGEIDQRLDEIAADPKFTTPAPKLRVIGIKCFEDGGMLTGSAYFTRPWGASSIYGIEDPAYRGMQYVNVDRLEAIISRCAKRNLAFTAHCQGDAAVESLVEAYRRVNKTVPIEPTHSSITHSSFMSRRAIEGAAEIGLGVDLQPAWLYLDARTLVDQFGDARLEYFIPLRSLFEANVVAGGGSDHMQKIGSLRSVNPYNPFLGMWIAVTRAAKWHDKPIHPEQALTRQQMIRFYTINNAWLMRMEEEIGSLEPGKRADFIVIDRDLLKCPADEIKSTKVESTWIDGKQFERSLD